MRQQAHLVQAVVIAFVFSVFVAVIVPVQTFLANRDLFEFSLGAVLGESLHRAGAVFGVSFVALSLLGQLFGRLGHVMLTALLVCAYFEVGVFSIGLPPLDGALIVFQNPFRALIDSALLALTFLIVVGLFRWTKRWCHWISLGVLFMGMASLFDVRPPVDTTASTPLSNGLCPQFDVVKSIRFSSKRNVIVLILDSTPASMTTEILRRRPDLQSRFSGFTAYEQNLAMSEKTQRGLPGLMTGIQLTPDRASNDYINSMYGPDSLLIPYVEADYPVYFDGALASGYTNRRLGDFSNEKVSLSQEGRVFDRNSTSIPYVTLSDSVQFRLTPYLWKCSVLSKAFARIGRDRRHGQLGTEDALYPLLAIAPISAETNTVLAIVHTGGIHGPIVRDKNGNPRSPTQDVSAHVEYGEFVMERVADFMDALKKSGVYDKSYVVICADHGLIVIRKGDGTKGHGADSSILWTKPIGATAPFTFSRLPTSNCRIAPLVKSLAHVDLDQAQTDAILRADNRRFIAKFGAKWWTAGRALTYYEWIYNDDGHVVSCEDRGVFKAN